MNQNYKKEIQMASNNLFDEELIQEFNESINLILRVLKPQLRNPNALIVENRVYVEEFGYTKFKADLEVLRRSTMDSFQNPNISSRDKKQVAKFIKQFIKTTETLLNPEDRVMYINKAVKSLNKLKDTATECVPFWEKVRCCSREVFAVVFGFLAGIALITPVVAAIGFAFYSIPMSAIHKFHQFGLMMKHHALGYLGCGVLFGGLYGPQIFKSILEQRGVFKPKFNYINPYATKPTFEYLENSLGKFSLFARSTENRERAREFHRSRLHTMHYHHL